MTTTPRIASNINDLRVGQAVAWIEPATGEWWASKVEDVECWTWTGTEVILSDPPPEPVTIPRDVYDRLKEVYEKGYSSRDALRAVIDAVEEDQS